jgi:hypothetical protein
MPGPTSARRPSLLAAGALVAAAIAVAVPPVQAAPVFTDAETLLQPSRYVEAYRLEGSAVTCGYAMGGTPAPPVPVVENGPATSVSTSTSATFTNSGDASDTGVGSASATGTGRVASVGGNPSTMDLTVTSNAELTNALGTSPSCVRNVSSGVLLQTEFTVTNPGFLELTTRSTGGVSGSVYLYQSSRLDSPYVDHSGNGLKFNTATRVYLPAGTYRGRLQGVAFKYSSSSYSISGTTTLHAEFHVAGSQTEAVSGKGKRYVILPAARSCATHALAPSIAGKRKRADQVKQVTFFVNGAKVRKVRNPHKGEAVSLPVADDASVDVRAEVKLVPRRKGKPAKVVEVNASYEACS